MYLFPIGTPAASASTGTVGTNTYSFFEPNDGATGSLQRNIQTILMQDKMVSAYKKNSPTRQIVYKYSNILTREYNVIKDFAYVIADGGLNSFFVVDLSAGEYVGTVASPYTISLSYTNLYSTVSSAGAYYGFAWNGSNFMIGTVSNKSSSSVSLTKIGGVATVTGATVYPVFEVFSVPGAMESFNSTIFYKSEGNNESGWLWEGSIMFTSKYPVG